MCVYKKESVRFASCVQKPSINIIKNFKSFEKLFEKELQFAERYIKITMDIKH